MKRQGHVTVLAHGRASSTGSPLRCGWLSCCLMAVACSGALCAADAPVHVPDSVHGGALRAAAQVELQAGRQERARDLLRLAAQADASLPMRHAEALRAQAGTGAADRLVLAQSANLVAQARSVVAVAEDLARQGRGEQAASLLEAAAAVLRTAAAQATSGELAIEATRLGNLAQAARVTSTGNGERQAAAVRTTAHDDAALRQAGLMANSAGTRAERLARIEAIEARGQYHAALSAARLLRRDLPNDAEVEGVHARLLDAYHESLRLDDRQRADDLRQELALLTELSMLPMGIDGMPVFPDDWERRGDRGSDLAGSLRIPDWEQALRAALGRRTSLEVEGALGTEVLEAIAKEQRLTMVIDPAVAAGAEIPITLRAPSIRLDHALTWVTSAMGTRWTLLNGAIYVGGNPTSEPVVQVHDISALIFKGVDAPTREIAFSASGGQGGSLFNNVSGSEGKVLTADEIVDLIKTAVSPLTWADDSNSGISIRGNNLLVTAPASVQRLLTEFIRAQEDQQVLQVRIDARWLDITDSFIEEIGVDWTGSGTPLSTQYSSGAYGERSNGVASASVASLLPATAMSINPVTAGTGLILAAKVFGVDQLSVVLQALERTEKARLVQQSAVTTLNGVRASVFAGTQTAYIATYNTVSSNLDPEIKVLNTGLNLEVRPLISADRKYVTLEIRPTVADVSFFSERINAVRVWQGILPQNQGGQNNTQDSIVTQFGGGYPIELPNVFLRTAGTSVSMPDKGSVLMGGFTKALDEFAVTRVPYLGSLPFLGRLFGKRGRYSDHRQLYLLTTATIISYDELEAKL